MRDTKLHLMAATLICTLVYLPSAATARISVSIGLGTYLGRYHPHYYGHWYPHYRWYGHHGPWWDHSYWPGSFCLPGSSFWFYSDPIVLDPPPRVKAPKAPEENSEPPQVRLSERMRREQSELLRMLRIGDKESRIGAIHELAAFYFDDKARPALEDVLLTDPDADIRKAVADALGKTGNVKVTAALKLAKAKDPDRDVRQAAYRSLIMIEGY